MSSVCNEQTEAASEIANAQQQQDEREEGEDDETWVDITSVVNQCASNLSFRHPILCNERSFSYHDSMAALEIMDPTMDCCQLSSSHDINSNQSKNKEQQLPPPPRPIPTLLQQPHNHDNIYNIPWTHFASPEQGQTNAVSPHQQQQQLEWIAQECWVLMDAYLRGTSMTESYGTCVYTYLLHPMKQAMGFKISASTTDQKQPQTDEPTVSLANNLAALHLMPSNHQSQQQPKQANSDKENKNQVLLTALIWIWLECGHLMRHIVMNADIYEEEDFSIQTHGILGDENHESISFSGSNGSDINQNGGTESSQYHASSDPFDGAYTTRQLLEHVFQHHNILALAKADQETLDSSQSMLYSSLLTLYAIYQACHIMASMATTTTQDTNASSNSDSDAQQQQQQKALQKVVDETKFWSRQAIAQIKQLQQIVIQAKKEEEQNTDKNSPSSKSNFLSQCFDPYLYRPLVGSSPIRNIQHSTLSQSLENVQEMMTQLEYVVLPFFEQKQRSLASLRLELQLISQRYTHRQRARQDTAVPKEGNNGKNHQENGNDDRQTTLPINHLHIVNRSLLVLNLYWNDQLLGRYDVQDLILQDIQHQFPHHASIIPYPIDSNDDEQLTSSSEHQQLITMEVNFLARLAKPLYDTLKLWCLNRNRQRSFLEVVMFPDWALLQQEARVVDAHVMEEINASAPQSPAATPLPSYRWTQYTICMTAWLMNQYVATFLDLGLVDAQLSFSWTQSSPSPPPSADKIKNNKTRTTKKKKRNSSANNNNNSVPAKIITTTTQEVALFTATRIQDVVMVYWYRDYILSTIWNTRLAASSPSASNGGGGGYAVGGDLEVVWVGIQRHLCRGIVRFIAALQQAHLLPTRLPQYEFTSHDERFQRRFQALMSLPQPPPLTYDDLIQGTRSSNNNNDTDNDGYNPNKNLDGTILDPLLSSTLECFHQAKRLLEHLKKQTSDVWTEDELRNLIKVCVGNTVFCMKLRQYCIEHARKSSKHNNNKAAAAPKVEFNFDAKSCFCTIQFSE